MSISPSPPSRGLRAGTYYWKCDRPSAFHGVLADTERDDSEIIRALNDLLSEAFPGTRSIGPAGGMGNHRTYFLRHLGHSYFVRVEDGPEGDGHLAVESLVLKKVAQAKVAVPKAFFTDASRQKVPFAVQVLEFFASSDLNKVRQAGALNLPTTAECIGRAIATWQGVPTEGFGPFDPEAARHSSVLRGYHEAYSFYFRLHLEDHLSQLKKAGFLSGAEAINVAGLIEEHSSLLNIRASCLVHKDLALWNILGTPEGIQAFIDWDDAIGGDPTDDLSLLGCFHSGDVISAASRGYETVRPLPENFSQRFWLHLLRNMIVKAVIRTGAGYFTQTSFLNASGQDGESLRRFTKARLLAACRGLRGEISPFDL